MGSYTHGPRPVFLLLFCVCMCVCVCGSSHLSTREAFKIFEWYSIAWMCHNLFKLLMCVKLGTFWSFSYYRQCYE